MLQRKKGETIPPQADRQPVRMAQGSGCCQEHHLHYQRERWTQSSAGSLSVQTMQISS
jgi:hypothetical protein